MRILVLGGGPGGHSAAFEAARLGAEVTLVEKENLGGTCLNWGCIPTKAILKSAQVAYDARRAEEFGLRLDAPEIDIERLMERKESVVTELRGQLEGTAKRLQIDVVYGEGRLTGPKTVRVTTEGTHVDFEPDAIILATGAVPTRLPGIDHSLERVWTSDEAVSLVYVPDRVLIIGGGVIGLEFACAYAAFGSEVHVVELTPSVLPGNDKRVQKAAQEALEGMGVVFHLGTSFEQVGQFGETMVTTLAGGDMIETDVVLSAAGRTPNSEGIGLDAVGVETDRAAVKVDSHFRTNVSGIYAVGDLIGGMMLAHVAEAEGAVAARNAIREYAYGLTEGLLEKLLTEEFLETVDHCCIPSCVYAFPNIATVGWTRDAAKAAGHDAVQAVAKFAGNGKALGEGEPAGFVQMVVANGTGHILGCQIVGPHAVETIHELALAMRQGLTATDVSEVVHAHPTVSEVIKAACLDAAVKSAG